MYLLEETPEAREMRKNLLQLLHSEVAENVELAYQLIEGGGLHTDIIGAIFTLSALDFMHQPHKGNKINTKPTQILRTLISRQDFNLYRELSIKFLTCLGYRERSFSDMLEDALRPKEDYKTFAYEFQKYDYEFLRPYWRAIARFRLCLYEGTYYRQLSDEELLRIATNDAYDTLDLSKYRFYDFPDCLAYVSIPEIRFDSEKLTRLQLPDWKNSSVHQVRFRVGEQWKGFDYWQNGELDYLKSILKTCFPNIQ